MAVAQEPVTAWDASGNPIQSPSPPPRPQAWDASGAPVQPPSVSLDQKQAQQATDALVYSHLTGAPPSFTYDNRDALHKDFGERLEGYAEAGWKGLTQDSIIGEYLRGQLSSPFDSDDEVSKFIEGVGTMIGDLPEYIIGAGLGSLAGGLAGTFEAPVVGTISGAVVGGGAGGFALTAGLRQLLIDKYKGDQISSFGEFIDVMKQAAKGAVTGAAFGFAGEAAPLAEGAVGRYLGPRAYKVAAELAAMTTVGSLVEGKVPTARDFAQNAALLAVMHVAMGSIDFAKKAVPELQSKSMDLYAKDGVHPSDLASEAGRRAVDEQPSDNPMEILNKIDNEIAGIPGKTPDAIAESEPTKPTKSSSVSSVSSEPAPSGDRETAIKNETTEAERAQRGLPEVEVEARRSFGTAFDAAKEAVNSGKIDPRALADELSKNPRPLSAEESAALVYDRMRLQNEHAAVMDRVEEAQATGDEAGEVQARAQLEKIENAINTNDEAARRTGYEQGLGLAARKMMLKQDYSLANVLQRARAASADGTVSPEVRDRLETLTKQLDDANQRIDAYEETKKQQSAERVVEKIKGDRERATRTGKRAATKEQLGAEYDSLLKDLNAELMQLSANPVLNPKLYELFGKLAVNRIHAGLITIDQIVDDLHGALQERGISKREIRDYISQYGRKIELSQDQIKVQLREAKAQGRLISALEDAQKKELPLRSGLQRGKPSDRVRDLQQQVREAIKQAGLGKEPTKTPEAQWASALDAVKTRLKNQITDITKRLETGAKEPKKEGVKLDEEAEDLKWLRDYGKGLLEEIEAKPGMSDEQKVKLATESVKKSITELERRIKDRDLSPRKQEPGPENADLKSLREQRDALRDTLDQMRKDATPKQGTNKEKTGQEAVAKSIAELERRIAEGDTSAPGRTQGPDTEAMASLKARRDALRETYDDMKSDATPKQGADKQATQVKALEKSIAELDRRIKDRDLSPKGKTEGPDAEQVSSLKAKRDALRETYDDLKEQANPKKTADEQNLSRYKKMLEKKISTMQGQLASGDFTKPTPRQTVLDQQAEDLKAQAEKIKSQVDDAINKQKLEARSPVEKGAALFQKWRRAVLLSSVNTLGKLTTAAMLRFGTTPIEELVGGVLSHVPGISDIAAKAPREGGGLNLSAEAKAFGQFFEKATASDIKEALKTGKTSLDYLYGKKSTLPPEALDFFGHLHGALKVLPKRAEFFRSLEKRADWALKNHLDINDPKVQATLAADAYIDANRAIFIQDNFFNTGFRMLMNYFHSKGLSGQATEFMIQTVLPIVKVPTNIIAETGTYTLGSVTGSLKALKTVISKDGLKNLTMHEADNIMRSLKKGSVGLAVLAMGYYAGTSTGFIQSTGFYQPGDEKKKQKPDTLTIGGVEVPPWLQHTPVGLVFEMGATARRVNDAYTVKGKSGGLVAGATAAGLGAAKKVPFLEEAARLGEAIRSPESAGLFLDDLIESLVIPPDVRKVAQMTDPSAAKRKPTDLKEALENAIPGLRENVPTKRSRKFSIKGAYR